MKLKETIKRIKPKVTVKSIAEYLGMSRSRFNLYINNHTPVENMQARKYLMLCDYLEVDYKYFID